jgi:hypothetical protein
MISIKLNDMEKNYKINRIKEIVKERIDEIDNKNIEHMMGQEIYIDEGKRNAYNQVLDAINSLEHIWG